MNDFFIVEYLSFKKKRGLYQLLNNNNKMADRSTNEMAIWLLVSAATNITGIPVAYLNYKKGRIFEKTSYNECISARKFIFEMNFDNCLISPQK